MGRSLTAEKQHENALKSLLLNANASDSKANSAILVGQQISDSRDHLLAIVPVDLAGDHSSEDAAIVDLSEKVAETLPGGICVLGVVFKLTNTDELKTAQLRFKQLLSNVWKRSKCVSNSIWVDLCGCGHQLLLYYNRNTKKFRFHWLQVSDMQASLQPGSDVKFISDPSPLLCIQSNINLPSEIVVSNNLSPSDILKSVSGNLCESLLSSIVLVGNRVPEDCAPIEKLVTKGLAKATSVLNVKMLNKMYTTKVDEDSVLESTSISNGVQVTVANGIHCRAYLPYSSTWSHLVKALKFDGVKSLIIRKNLLLDELADLETTSIVNEQQMLLAQRVCVNDSRIKFALNDYAMMEETSDDVKERMEAIWGGLRDKYSLVYVENHSEGSIGKKTITKKAETDSLAKEKEPINQSNVTNGISQYLYTLIAVIVLVVGLLVALFILY